MKSSPPVMRALGGDEDALVKGASDESPQSSFVAVVSREVQRCAAALVHSRVQGTRARRQLQQSLRDVMVAVPGGQMQGRVFLLRFVHGHDQGHLLMRHPQQGSHHCLVAVVCGAVHWKEAAAVRDGKQDRGVGGELQNGPTDLLMAVARSQVKCRQPQTGRVYGREQWLWIRHHLEQRLDTKLVTDTGHVAENAPEPVFQVAEISRNQGAALFR
mmetsp:Transcript_102049/g.327480  ORF Transcript_102049/g.327480 Transcript_102049/m.327480 type:complete len:215 (-) Transcript_102049:4153-4797(-)